MGQQLWKTAPHIALRAGSDFDLSALDRSGTPGFSGGKAEGRAQMAERSDLLNELQERLFADGRYGGSRSVLLILQGLDTAGKGGIVRHVMGMVDPQGVALASFGVPTEEELAHHYLWRIKKRLPRPGKIGVFDRSHYEDVLVARVDGLVDEEEWRGRYEEINRFEKRIVDSGTIIIKAALMHSKDEQAGRLLERIERPDKRWKLSPSDLVTRSKWDDYQEAYEDIFRLTSTDHAPWYVIPGDKKWYARAAVTELLTQALIDIDPQWPKPRWHVDVQRRRLLETVDPDVVDELVEAVQEQLKDAEADRDSFLAQKEEAKDLAGRDNGDRAPSHSSVHDPALREESPNTEKTPETDTSPDGDDSQEQADSHDHGQKKPTKKKKKKKKKKSPQGEKGASSGKSRKAKKKKKKAKKRQ